MASEFMEQLLYEVHFGAQQRVLHGPYTTGNLALKMYRRGPFVSGTRVLGKVGNDAPYAAAVHNGAQVHPIFPKSARGQYRFGSHRRPQLRFFWRKAGHVVFMPQVPGSPGKMGLSHPGQPGKRFLVEPLLSVAARHNMKVVVYDI